VIPNQLAHIRADIAHAIAQSGAEDPSLLPDLLDHLLSALGEIALGRCPCNVPNPDGPQRDCPLHGDFPWIIDGLLEECQVRAISRVPFSEAGFVDESPHWREHL